MNVLNLLSSKHKSDKNQFSIFHLQYFQIHYLRLKFLLHFDPSCNLGYCCIFYSYLILFDDADVCAYLLICYYSRHSFFSCINSNSMKMNCSLRICVTSLLYLHISYSYLLLIYNNYFLIGNAHLCIYLQNHLQILCPLQDAMMILAYLSLQFVAVLI